ncbi:CCA tRNA nucleotidyltransferase [Clostridium aestuarii]|uniref:CCA tRNA nucleotidyltransferase n=1 Tax=Clostridium aestuarii TaxID=338193 RepID=A0ABT4CXS9_9CLOT|nr:CCA tRNA nucleotidyltransferase [Clostridium aestuarii]MCY6483774.1 CCA tRNA nucleotidyltransferase [Clostridium aestuarii]
MNIMNNFDKDDIYIVNLIKEECIRQNVKVYIVGGAVRDAILHRKVNDIDICIECDPINIIKKIKEIKKYIYYKEFKTSNIIFNNNVTIDLIHCRKEGYEYSGALPKVTPSNLYDDLYRRDFTINAMAYDIIDDKLIDLYDGMKDIKAKRIRKVHRNSYNEDPTRIFRAIRYSARYEFDIYDKNEISTCIREGIIKNISDDRVIREILLLCMESKWKESVVCCNQFNIMQIEVDLLEKDNILCDYLKINTRILNLFFASKQNEFREMLINNSILEKELRNSLKRYRNMTNEIQTILSQCVDNFDIYKLLKKFSLYELILISFFDVYKYKIMNYLSNLKEITLDVDGKYLMDLGIEQGKNIGNVMNYLLELKLNTGIRNEKEYLNKNSGEILNAVKH